MLGEPQGGRGLHGGERRPPRKQVCHANRGNAEYDLHLSSFEADDGVGPGIARLIARRDASIILLWLPGIFCENWVLVFSII